MRNDFFLNPKVKQILYIFFNLLLSFTLLSCNQKDNNPAKLDNTNINIDWLVGSWIRTNDNPQKQTHEEWEKISHKEYIGIGCTLENSDTTFKENMRITNSNDIWTLEVRGVNENMTPFVFTNLTDSSFTCENQQNEFPKKIKYSLNNNNLIAAISADSVEIIFSFQKTIRKKINDRL